MKSKKFLWSFLTVIMLLSMTVGSALAEDGVIFRRNISKTPDNETEKAAIYMMDFYVPAQNTAGELLTGDTAIQYTFDTGETFTREFAKPLVSVWIDDLHPEEEEVKGGMSFGHFDAFAGVSLDDGATWKRTNLSRSSDLSSFNLATGYAYPGDVHNVVHQVAGDNIFVAWVSKYCDGGTPLYKLANNLVVDDPYFDDLMDEATYAKDALYMYDLFGVNGQQGSVDYTLQGHPEVGEIPYSCVWTARGKLLYDVETGTSDVMWTKPERLTSGARDANLPAVDCAKDVGCILTWQEDPEGLRPGQGLGPGEGWSGAIANGKTDIWYSYISFADFDWVFADDTIDVDTEMTMADYALLVDAASNLPKPYVPMAMPTRLTDNNMCKASGSDPYCYIDFDDLASIDPLALPEARITDAEGNSSADFCASTVKWSTPGGSTLDICVTDDGRVLNGRVASTRVRLNLKPYDFDADKINDIAWVVMAAEETKALGDVLIDIYGEPAEDPIDIGKDIWYYSFDMFDHPIIDQGGMLNQPAVCSPWTVYADETSATCTPYEFFPVQTSEIYEKDSNGNILGTYVIGDFYLTEIARRFALTTNSVGDAMASNSKLSAMLIYKQGIINQGGPADIMLRRVVLPTGFDPAVDNPYAFENMECGTETFDTLGNQTGGWIYTDGSNPNYLKGLCLSPAINISGTTIVECTAGALGNDDCADTFPVADDGSIPDSEGSFPKVFEWRQLPYDATVTDGDTFNADNEPDETDLDDQTWENPFDLAKGHRGFLDKDYVMMMYAWSPNWKAQTVGNDHYNLYVRRSFDGGVTWTTTPTLLGGEGVKVEELYCVEDPSACEGTEFVYGAGADEQGRNVSQLIGNKITILDPRYSPTGGLKLYSTIRTDWLTDNGIAWADLPYGDDLIRDPSKFFMIYETGDNTTVAEGEAVPLNLYYSRATVYGDVWELDPDYITVDETTGEIISIEDYRWLWVENKADILSGEAGMLANPGGSFMYAVWNQWQEDEFENISNSDIIFRRFMYNEETITPVPMDLAPVVTLLSSPEEIFSTDTDDWITFYADARDLDTLGDGDQIVEYEWMVNGIPFPTSYVDLGVDCFKDKQCKAPARVIAGNWDGMKFQEPGWSGDDGNGTFNHGWYTFSVRAKDNEGHYSKWVKVQKKIVANAALDLKPFSIFNPLITK